MKTETFEAELLSKVLLMFSDWREDNDVTVYSCEQIFDLDVPCTMTIHYVENTDAD